MNKIPRVSLRSAYIHAHTHTCTQTYMSTPTVHVCIAHIQMCEHAYTLEYCTHTHVEGLRVLCGDSKHPESCCVMIQCPPAQSQEEHPRVCSASRWQCLSEQVLRREAVSVRLGDGTALATIVRV